MYTLEDEQYYDNFTYDKLGYIYERHAIRVSNMIHGHCLAWQNYQIITHAHLHFGLRVEASKGHRYWTCTANDW